MVDSKYFGECGEERPLDLFTRDKRRKDGLSFYCRDHARKRLRESKLRRHGPPRSRHVLDRIVPEGHKWCPDCDTVKSVDEFPRTSATRTGRHTYCLPCHNARGRASLDKVGGSRTYHLKRRYGIFADDADAMLAAQGGVCAICRVAPAVHVDHDHATGAVRALLCFNCNGGLGQFKDDPGLLHAAAYYVALHTARQEVAAELAAMADGSEAASRPGTPPVGSQRRPGSRGTSSRTTGRSSGTRRRQSAGEADT
jgi:Recombination endonuclease VII